MKNLTGRVLRIEKTSIHDGDGLRTVIFMKGCPMKCKWCSTPESQSLDFECGFGMDMTVSEVMNEISKDEIFYFHSGGGVTISGGEALLQSEFVCQVLGECVRLGIDTAIETSMFGAYAEIERLLPFLNTVYADIKHMDDTAHLKYTGVSNRCIIGNIKKLSESNYSGEIIIRLPVIPTVNMTAGDMKSVAEFCANLRRIKGIELLPYHRLGIESYNRLNRVYELSDISPPEENEIAESAEIIKRYAPGVRVWF